MTEHADSRTKKSNIIPWIVVAVLALLLIIFVVRNVQKNDDATTKAQTEQTDDNGKTEKEASDQLKKDEKTIQKDPAEVIEAPDISPTKAIYLTTKASLEDIVFEGDAGFKLWPGAKGSMPIFYFRKNLLKKAGYPEVIPLNYKGGNKFQEKGVYYFFIDDGKTIVKSPGDSVLITANAYLGDKKVGNETYEAWLAWELNSNLYRINDDSKAKIWANPDTKGIDFAIKVSGYKFAK